METETKPRKRDVHLVVRWRYEELVRAGYSERDAMAIADRPDIDLHVAVDLARAGCPPATALGILL